MDKWFKISGWQGSVLQEEIPVLPYADFFQQLYRALERESCHIASYFGVPESDALRLYCLMLDDASGEVMIVSCLLEGYGKDQVSRTTDSQEKQELIPSLTARVPAMLSLRAVLRGSATKVWRLRPKDPGKALNVISGKWAGIAKNRILRLSGPAVWPAMCSATRCCVRRILN